MSVYSFLEAGIACIKRLLTLRAPIRLARLILGEVLSKSTLIRGGLATVQCWTMPCSGMGDFLVGHEVVAVVAYFSSRW